MLMMCNILFSIKNFVYVSSVYISSSSVYTAVVLYIQNIQNITILYIQNSSVYIYILIITPNLHTWFICFWKLYIYSYFMDINISFYMYIILCMFHKIYIKF